MSHSQNEEYQIGIVVALRHVGHVIYPLSKGKEDVKVDAEDDEEAYISYKA